MKAKRILFVLSGVFVLVVSGSVSASTLIEDFNDGLAATRWSVAVQIENTADPGRLPDGTVNLAFDYSTLGIANPNGGSDTIGAFIQVNNTDQTGDEGETYIIYPNAFSVSGKFKVYADMFVYNDGGAGTTELGMIGAFLDNSVPIAPYQWGSEGGPLAWIYSGEGGSTADFARFAEGTPDPNGDRLVNPDGLTGYTALADYNTVPAGTIPGFETGVAGAFGPAAAANPRGSWVKVGIESDGTMIDWYVNGVLVNSYDNSGGFYTAGNIFFGATDPFNSTNAGGGTIIDNVVVVPEPASAGLMMLGLVGMFAGWRRSR